MEPTKKLVDTIINIIVPPTKAILENDDMKISIEPKSCWRLKKQNTTFEITFKKDPEDDYLGYIVLVSGDFRLSFFGIKEDFATLAAEFLKASKQLRKLPK